jgi:hypothetical protein
MELRDRIAAALSRHRPRWGEWVTCTCDNDFSRFTAETYEWHVADAVIEALDLRIEDKCKTASGQKQLFGVSGFWEVDGD